MNIIPIINDFTNNFNEIFKTSLSPLDLENKTRGAVDMFTLKLYEYFLIILIKKYYLLINK